jgi:hypothetical protein
MALLPQSGLDQARDPLVAITGVNAMSAAG